MRRALAVLTVEGRAPEKPDVGAACNGCGVCCLAEPCPLGVVLSGRTSGACAVLVWRADEERYRCDALSGMLAPLARRWISAGSGCDSTVVTSPGEARDA